MIVRLALLPLLLSLASAQTPNPVSWTASATPSRVKPGETVVLKVTAAIDDPWHLYSVTSPLTATATRFSLPEGSPLTIERVFQIKPVRRLDPSADQETESYEKQADFYLEAKVASNATAGKFEGTVIARISACKDKICLPPKKRPIPIAFTIDPAAPASPAFTPPAGIVEAKADAKPVAAAMPATAPQGLGAFLLLAFTLGIAAIFTPCVFPMIPFTLSYFLNREGASRGDALRQAIVFCLGIVVLFTGLGFLLTALVGPFGVIQLASNPWVNAVISLVFFAFALSLLGVFELTLPSSLLTRLNDASSGGGFVGSLLMGLTFSLTSFACVGPFVGTLLAASVQGEKLQPVLGMASFATGLAAPFFLLALFPGYLKKLPRSGVWMVRVKVVMGFLILAAMLKYMSNVDQVMQWNFLTRERFLAAWIVLFSMPAFYLLGWLRVEGVKPEEEVTAPRLLIAILLLAFSVSLIPGLGGAPIGSLDAYVPIASRTTVGGGAASVQWMKNDYQGALAKAKAEGKMVFVNFTGYACAACHLMKASIFPRPEIAAAFKNYVLLELYTDGTDSASEENQKLQESTYKTAAIPFYAIVDAEGATVRTFPGATNDPQEFLKFLNGA